MSFHHIPGELRDAAIGYATRGGWFIFPLLPRRKTPATTHGFKDASTDVGLVSAWWDETPAANIGLDCGRSGLLVVDLDGREGIETWRTLVSQHGASRTLGAKTSTGWHLYYAGPGPTTTRRLGAGIDTRGRGGYTILPPSVHPSGWTYRWHDSASEPEPAPAWILEALAPVPVTAVVGERRALPPGHRATHYGRVALEGLVDDVLAAVEGTRNATFHRASRRAGRLEAAGEIAADVAELVLLAAASSVGLPHDEAIATFRSGFAFGQQYPTARASA